MEGTADVVGEAIVDDSTEDLAGIEEAVVKEEVAVLARM